MGREDLKIGKNLPKKGQNPEKGHYDESPRFVNRSWRSFCRVRPRSGYGGAGFCAVWTSSNFPTTSSRDGTGQEPVKEFRLTSKSALKVNFSYTLFGLPKDTSTITLQLFRLTCARSYRNCPAIRVWSKHPFKQLNLLNIRRRDESTLGKRQTRMRGWSVEGGDRGGFVWTTVEGGVRDPGIFRVTPLDLSPWAPEDSSQGIPAYLLVDTMHKSESCNLLF